MVAVPAAIIFVNNDLTTNVANMLIKQLHITTVMNGSEFDTLLVAEPTFTNRVQQLDLRILVVRSMDELDNRAEADVVCFFKNGLISILQNNFGPPGKTLPVVNLDWGDLLY